VVTIETLAERAELIAASPDLRALLAHLRERARPVIERMPVVPEQKALLSTDGGICPDDGATLIFDPWSPTSHRCPRCSKNWSGERHDRHWARFQHLWLAERAGHLAALASLGSAEAGPAAARARDILAAYAERYWRYPNRDNVLGPSRLFFSTYLESLWMCNYLAAATLLRDAGQLDEAATRGVNQVVEEAAALIGEYDEQFSNRQTWNNAALAAVAVWFEDEELAQRVIEGPTGLIAHLMRGYGRDGLWYEGENYHLFALRGLLTGAGWARLAGVDFAEDPRLMARLEAALRAPALSALPDFTFPARKDARFNVSLAQPVYLELWEIGLAEVGRGTADDARLQDISAWLQELYSQPAPPAELLDWYLHDAGAQRLTPVPGSRSALSWWALLEMLPELPEATEPWRPPSILLESQGLAVLRQEHRYVSLECGQYGGGHGHPDRLHLTLHADGVHWLADPGTGSYVARDLFWYRSTLAHNAPRLDGESQPPENAVCEAFAQDDDWGWVRGRYGALTRTLVSGPVYILDIVELVARDDHLLELPWHPAGRGDIETRGRWVSDALESEYVTRVERFVPEAPGSIAIAHVDHGRQLTLHLAFDGELLRAEGPPRPGGNERIPFYLQRARGRNLRLIGVLEPTAASATVRGVRVRGDAVEIDTAAGTDRHRFGSEWTIEQSDGSTRVLRGLRQPEPPFTPLLELDPPVAVSAPAFRVGSTPPLDGTFEGFDLAEPLQLSLEDQYRRSEDAYPGPDDLSALAYAAWDEAGLYLAIAVTKPDVCLRAAGAPPLRLDNEPDDIHSDGVQVYLAAELRDHEQSPAAGFLIVPEPDSRTIRVTATSDSAEPAAAAKVRGAWRRTENGYHLTLGIPWPANVRPHAGARVRFDLIVNEMLPGRLRRVGQLVWSGGGGWIWLRGDRQDPSRFGILELVV